MYISISYFNKKERITTDAGGLLKKISIVERD
jgi:hypothetical protein